MLVNRIATLTFIALAALWTARADEITISFTSPTQIGTPGGTLEFDGTLTNLTSDEVFLNGIDWVGDLEAAGATEDSTPFFSNPDAPVSLLGFQTAGPFSLFDVTLPSSIAPGIYNETMQMEGGADDSAADVVGSELFTVQVQGGPVPEPAEIWLGLISCAGLAAAGRLRARARNLE
jgi:hypothetical protein